MNELSSMIGIAYMADPNEVWTKLLAAFSEINDIGSSSGAVDVVAVQHSF